MVNNQNIHIPPALESEEKHRIFGKEKMSNANTSLFSNEIIRHRFFNCVSNCDSYTSRLTRNSYEKSSAKKTRNYLRGSRRLFHPQDKINTTAATNTPNRYKNLSASPAKKNYAKISLEGLLKASITLLARESPKKCPILNCNNSKQKVGVWSISRTRKVNKSFRGPNTKSTNSVVGSSIIDIKKINHNRLKLSCDSYHAGKPSAKSKSKSRRDGRRTVMSKNEGDSYTHRGSENDLLKLKREQEQQTQEQEDQQDAPYLEYHGNNIHLRKKKFKLNAKNASIPKLSH